MTWHSLISKVA